ncbi:hypothetical protein GLW08_12865 [Pontibacillus yanchengensis]|uniref:Uncharacterized protein n=2 Tax=Pontibacillus yanchengensis TaxID=462910 RepID=A0ACC7VHX4_9BACI|nr:hypothetical protein [Pontibacillus yanchengensis]MYL34417.1 hypothetical protein [Pontibacillus yanchengensis]MYL54225.1 hypothetical protein [Pontibacillus yanchengensis]
MKNRIILLFIFIPTLLLVACQQEETSNQEESKKQQESSDTTDDSTEKETTNQSQNESESEKSSTTESSNTKEKAEESSSTQNEPTLLSEEEITVQSLKEKLSLEMTAKEVKQLLGEPSQKVQGAKDGTPMLRYDLKTTEGYSFEDPNGMDSIDMEGFQNKQVEMIVFVDIPDDTVSRYSIQYWDEEGHAKVYMKSPDYEKTDDMGLSS